VAGDERKAGGAPDPVDALRGVSAAPQQVLDLAEACVRFVAAKYGLTLDFQPDTLSLLDQWLRETRRETGERPETAQLVQSAAGAYLGEVVRREFGATWSVQGDYPDWRLYLEPVYCAFNPIGMAREAILLEPQEGWHAHFELDPAEAEAIESRLAALPQVEEDEYYAPTTRYDVVCIVVEALREGMRARGMGDVAFAPEDYGAPPRGTNGKL
jgi:hypothetical protein